MALTIWKYALKVADSQVLPIPDGAPILALQVQHGVPCIWARVDPDAAKAKGREFVIVGTGHPLPPGSLIYIGSYQVLGGKLVFHVFEREEETCPSCGLWPCCCADVAVHEGGNIRV